MSSPHPRAPVIVCPSLPDLELQLERIYRQLENTGFVIVKAWDGEESTILEVARHFGRVQHHPKANPLGVVNVTPERAKGEDLSFDRNVSKTSEEFLLHTDGSFLNGICQSDERLFRVQPPVIFLLQCVRPAVNGGVNVLVDTQRVFLDLLRHQPELAQIITSPGALSYFGGDQMAVDYPMFEHQGGERWQLRFRWDLGFAKPWARDAVQLVVRNYFFNPEYQVRHKLEAGEILIVDNGRMLHGRGAIQVTPGEPPRVLRRVWIWDETSEEVRTLDGLKLSPLALKALQSHYPIGRLAESSLRRRWLDLGIRVERNIAQSMFSPNGWTVVSAGRATSGTFFPSMPWLDSGRERIRN